MMNKFLFMFLRYSGLASFFRLLIQKNKITIVLLHDPDPPAAEKAFEYLKKRYHLIDLNDYIKALKSDDFSSIPPYAMIITFDDGHINNHKLLPLIKKHKVPVTIFLCASIVNTNRHYWFKHKVPGVSTLQLKSFSNTERLSVLAKNDFKQDGSYAERKSLNKKEIDEMIPFVNMQSHTLYHPILPKCSSAAAKNEIENSKQLLENDFDIAVNTISYPNGDYSDRDIEFSKKAGYECGITVDYGFNTKNTDPFRLKRISLNDSENLNELAVKSSGLWAFIKTRNGRNQKHGFHAKTE